MAARGVPVLPISAATGEGVGPLLDAVAQVLSGGALPALGRAERPRRRPKAQAVASTEEVATSTVRGGRAGATRAPRTDPKREARPAKKSTARKRLARAAPTGDRASPSRGATRKGPARSSRRPAGKGTR